MVTALCLTIAPFLLGSTNLAHSGPAFTGRECPSLPSPGNAQESAIGTADSLALRLTVPERVRQGEAVQFTFRVENVSGRHLNLYLRGREITFDVVVTDHEDALVWRRLAGEVVPAILRLEPLAAGAVLELSGIWDQRLTSGAPAPTGDYCIQVELLTEGNPILSPKHQFEIGTGR